MPPGRRCRRTDDLVYVTVDELRTRFGADEIDELGDDARALAAIADACAEIDAALTETYVVPLHAGQWPSLTSIAADIARAKLYDDEAPDRVLGRLSSARKRLSKLATGEVRLVDSTGVEATRHATILVDAGTPVATPERLSGYLNPTPARGPFEGSR